MTFLSFQSFLLNAFLISLLSVNLICSIDSKLNSPTNHEEVSLRTKRETSDLGSLQHPAVQPQSSVPKQSVSSNTCSYKATLGSCLAEARYRTFDGSCNNLENPWWGTSSIPYERFAAPTYADGAFLPRNQSVTGKALPTPRQISNACSNEVGAHTERSIDAFFTSFGQFVDHDVSNTATARDDENKEIICNCQEENPNPFCLNIPTPDMPDQLCMLFPRSSALFQRETACQLTAREQINQINSFLDISVVYGNNKQRADQLRTFTKGQLKTTMNKLPPQAATGKEQTSCRNAQANRGCFFCGDVRSNENIGLTSLHTIFVRLHNQVALELSQINPSWTDEIIYDETRRMINAIFQHIVYDEFLPLVLGRSLANFGPYQYDASVNPTIKNEFATAAYRFGHTLVNGFLRRFNNQHQLMEEVSLSQCLFRPTEAYNQQMGGLDTLIFGLLLTPASKFDSMINDVLRNHLFESDTVNSHLQTKRFDLTSININRGRDHGIPTYNSMRELCGLRRASSFNDLQNSMDVTAVQRLASVYADVDDIDLYIGGISERSVADGIVGPTFACIIASQFNDLRRGDRYFYQTQDPAIRFSPEQLSEIQRVTMSHILCETVEDMNEVQKDAFQTANKINNPHVSCSSLPWINLNFWRG